MPCAARDGTVLERGEKLLKRDIWDGILSEKKGRVLSDENWTLKMCKMPKITRVEVCVGA